MAKSKKTTAPPKKRGGPRTGAGRKPVDELKKPITIYVKESSIEGHGGEVALKELLTTVAESQVIRENDTIPKRVAPITQEQAVALHNAENKDQFTEVFPGRQLHNGEIMKQIAAIEAETIPKERDTYFGKKAWKIDRDKRISELKKQLK